MVLLQHQGKSVGLYSDQHWFTCDGLGQFRRDGFGALVLIPALLVDQWFTQNGLGPFARKEFCTLLFIPVLLLAEVSMSGND